MKIIGTTNKQISCIWTTIGKAIEGLGEMTNIETIIYDREDFLNNRIEPTKEEVVFIFEAGTPQHAGYSMEKMKNYFPNSRFIALSSDAVIYKDVLKYDQLDYNYVDILLDVEDKALDYLKGKYSRLICDKWMWTISGWLFNEATDYALQHGHCALRKIEKEFDFICVAIFAGDYRQRLRQYLEYSGFKFTNGGGNGHEDNDLQRLFRYYSLSRWTLGTTSHNNPAIRGMKGFRDWLGPVLGAPLIYDNYNQVMAAYGSIVPYYEYTDFSSITTTVNRFSEEQRMELAYDQWEWIRFNTIEEQLFKVCKRYGIL